MTDYHASCSCGRDQVVQAKQAGTMVTCVCGTSFLVPPLSRLRRNAGQADYETGTLDTIRRLCGTGELPIGQLCVLSGRPTRDRYEVEVLCEQPRLLGRPVGTRFVLGLFIMLLSPLLGLLILIRSFRPSEDGSLEQGHERTIFVTIPLHADETAAFRKIRSQSRLRTMLRSEPMYERMFKEYPRAVIKVR